MHICVSNPTIIGPDNGLSPRRRQAIIWTNAEILSIGLLGTKFNDILIEILRVSFKKMCLKGSSAKWRPFCLGLNVLNHVIDKNPKVIPQQGSGRHFCWGSKALTTKGPKQIPHPL